MIRRLIVIAFLFAGLSTFSQSVLKGYAPEFIGQNVKLYTYQDYLTLSKILIGEGTVSAEDSTFSIEFDTKTTIQAVVEIDRNEAELYLAPETNYEIYFPRSIEPVSYKNAETNIYFSELDTLDINYLVLQYHQWFDTFIAYYEEEIGKGQFLAYLDTFKVYAAEAYKDIDDIYFITYVRYDIAEMEQAGGGIRKSENRLNAFLDYIEPYPVYYENDRYMKFVTGFYDKEFREYLPKTEQRILEAVAASSPTLLMKALKSDIFLAKPELRELIMLDKLGKAFYRELELRPNIITILDSVANHSISPANASVAKNVRKYITSLEPGYPAPAIDFPLAEDKSITWRTYQGKFVYFNFFATWNDKAVAEMELISGLLNKYDEDIAFLSVCTDKTRDTYTAFIDEHPEYDWDIVYVGEDKPLMEAFKVSSVPSYFLIDQDGFIFSAPALSPTPNGEFKSIDKTLFNIQRALHPTQRPRVGE